MMTRMLMTTTDEDGNTVIHGYECEWCHQHVRYCKCDDVIETGDNVTPLTGGTSPYYSIEIASPTDPGKAPYVAECNDLIEALQMNFAEGNIFKALWRICAERLGKGKPGNTELYDAEKVAYFGERRLKQAKQRWTCTTKVS